jgi:hypothetical protein
MRVLRKFDKQERRSQHGEKTGRSVNQDTGTTTTRWWPWELAHSEALEACLTHDVTLWVSKGFGFISGARKQN